MLNLKIFHALDVLDKLQGLWVNQNSEILYVLATRITFICAMSFEAFPLDIQTCLFQVSMNKELSRLFDNHNPRVLDKKSHLPFKFFFISGWQF